MVPRLLVVIAAAFAVLTALILLRPAHMITAATLPCSSDLPAGELTEPPVADVSLLPRNAQGMHELILHVAALKDRFCYRYELNGTEQSVAPTISVHRRRSFRAAIDQRSSRPRPTIGRYASSSAL